MFFVEEIIEAVSSIAKKIKIKIKWIFELNVWSIIKQGYDRPVSITAEITRLMSPFTGIYNMSFRRKKQ